MLISIYPPFARAADGSGLDTSTQTVPAHLLGRVPTWDAGTVDRSVAVDEHGDLVRPPDTFECFHWLRRGYAVLCALPPRGYLMLHTESSERTLIAAVRKMDEQVPLRSSPSQRQ